MIQIRERDRRALLVLGIAAILYVVLDYVVIPGFAGLTTASEEATLKEDELRKYRRAVIRKGHYTQLLAEATKNLAAAEERLIRGDNPSLASVEFQTIVEGVATATGISLGQRNMSTAKKKDDFFNEITMTLSFDCTPNQLTTFLSEIRNAPKFISIRTIQVTPSRLLHEPPARGDFQKVVRVTATLGAILATAPRGAL